MNTITVRSKVTFRDKAKSDIVDNHDISFNNFEEFQREITKLHPTYKHEYSWDETLTRITQENYNSERQFTFAFFTCMDLESTVNCTLRLYHGPHQSQETRITHSSLPDLRAKVQAIYPSGSELQLFLLADSAAMPLNDILYDTLSGHEYIVATLLSGRPQAHEITSPRQALKRLHGRLDQLLMFA